MPRASPRSASYSDAAIMPCAVLTPVAVIPVLVVVLIVFADLPNNGSVMTGHHARLRTDDLERMDIFFQPRNDMELRFRSDSGDVASLLDCEQISKMLLTISPLTNGWTKTVYRARMGNRSVAVKLVNEDGETMRRCLQQKGPRPAVQRYCRDALVRKFIKEIVALNRFRHPSIIKMIGYCIPFDSVGDNFHILSIVSELGEPMQLIQLLQLSWESRLKLFVSIVDLLEFLANHPDGPIVLNDFRAQQFVVVDGQLKLVDFDDVGLEEAKCSSDSDCNAHLKRIGLSDLNRTVPCLKGGCDGSNDVKNIYKAARSFLFLIQHGVSPWLQGDVDRLIGVFQNQSLPSSALKSLVQRLIDNYATGRYLKAHTPSSFSGFIRYANTDLPMLYDYPCRDSFSPNSCVLSVANLHEAKYLCSVQAGCQAIVWTNQQSWTGRRMVHFKSNFTRTVYSENSVLFVKRSR